ncbi:MAG: hypothetical protein HY686_09220 [Chloroflexi bacterium]|nr:hypothetical protein [Chloroflexota bacterium]
MWFLSPQRTMLGLVALLVLVALGCRAAAPAPTPAPAAKPAAPAAVAPSPTPRPAVAAPSPVATVPTPTPKPAVVAPSPAARAVPQKMRYIPWSMPINRNGLDHNSHQSDTSLVYDNLLHLTVDGISEPAVATSWESISPTVWRFKIRQGIRFSNGDELTAEDVAFSATTAKQERLGSYTATYPTFDKAVVVDKYTVDIHTVTRDVLFPSKAYYLWIVPKNYYTEKGGTKGFLEAPIGSGPCRYTAWSADVSFKVECNPGKHAFRNWNIESIDAQQIQETATVSAALLSGAIDLAQRAMEPDLLDELRAKGMRVEAIPARLFIYFYFAFEACEKKWPTCDPRVRRALQRAIDQETYAKVLWKGLAVPAPAPGLPGGPGYRGDLPIPYNPEEAKRLLDEAGFKAGPGGVRVDSTGKPLELRMWAWAAGAPHLQSLAMQADLAKVGVKANYQLMEYGLYVSYLGRREGREHVELMQLLGTDKWSNSYAYISTWAPRDPKTTSNYWFNEKARKLEDEYLSTFDPKEQSRLMGEIFKIMRDEDPPYIFANAVPEIWIMQPYMEGFKPMGGRAQFRWDNIRRTR